MKRFVSIGECMIELSGGTDDLWRMGIAGDTLNTAWYARASLPDDWRVSYGTVIGSDGFSAKVPAFLTANGIHTDALFTHPNRSIGLYAISLTNGERSFSYWRDTSAAKTLADDPAMLATMTDGAEMVHVSGITLAILSTQGRQNLIAHLMKCRANGVKIVLDPNIRMRLWEDAETAKQILTAAAQAADIILPSFDDEATLFGDASPEETCQRYLDAGVKTVVVKNGAGPMTVHENGKSFLIDGLKMVNPIDTTGAGDSFNGAFLAALLQGQSILSAVHAGHAMAAKVVMHHGALVPMDAL